MQGICCLVGFVYIFRCSCGGVPGGLCEHQLATISARIEQQSKYGFEGLNIAEPLSDTVLRMSREQLAAALLEISSPEKQPWLVGKVSDLVARVIREHVPSGVSVPTYPQSSSHALANQVSWYFGSEDLGRPIKIKGERLVEIERSADREFINLERLSHLPGKENDTKLIEHLGQIISVLKDALEGTVTFESFPIDFVLSTQKVTDFRSVSLSK